MRLLFLPDVLRRAGLSVHEVTGWRTRGADSFGPVRGITCHHTAGPPTSSDNGEINVLVNGRVGLPGPIAQLYLSRTGHWWVVASGHCNHNLPGWGGPNEGYGNDSLLGIEAQHSGENEPWTDVQYRSYVRGVAALVRHKASGYSVPLSHVAGHKEHQPGAKFDPSFSMDRFRADVGAVLAGKDDMTPAELFAATIHNPITDKPATFAAFIQSINSNAYQARLDLAAGEAREVARDAAAAAMLTKALAAAGNPLSGEQFAEVLNVMRTAAAEAGESVAARLEAKLAAAAQAEADTLAAD